MKGRPKKKKAIYAIFNKFGQRMYHLYSSEKYENVCLVCMEYNKKNKNAGYHIEKVEEE